MAFLTRNITKILGVAILAAVLPLSAMADEPVYQFRMHEMGVEQPSTIGPWAEFLLKHGEPVPEDWSTAEIFLSGNHIELPDIPYPSSSLVILDLTMDDVSNVNSLLSLKSVKGDLILTNNNLTRVDGLSNLKSVGGKLNLFGNRFLTNVNGLSNLVSVGGGLSLGSNDLTSVNGLSSLKSVGGNLDLSFNYHLTNVDGLSSLESVGGTLYLIGGGIVDLSGLANITSIGGDVEIDRAIYFRPGFVPIPASAWLCQPAQADKFNRASQSVACGKMPSLP